MTVISAPLAVAVTMVSPVVKASPEVPKVRVTGAVTAVALGTATTVPEPVVLSYTVVTLVAVAAPLRTIA
jgi:hypothetical protein